MTRALLVTIAVLSGAACVPVVEPFARSVVPRDAGVDPDCAAPGSRERGAHCRCTADCAGDAICLTEEVSKFPQGLCAEACLGGAPCGDGFACSNLSCLARCESDADCKSEAFCVGGKCVPFCDSDDDCLSGNCNRYIGNCLPAGEVPQGLGLDAPCTVAEQCRSRLCLEGHCTTPCSVMRGNCPDDGVCRQLLGDVGRCHPRCGPGGTCTSTDRQCLVVTANEPGVCLPSNATGCVGRQPSPTAGQNCGCNDDCEQGAPCLRESTSGIPYGLCAVVCSSDAQCPATHACYGGACLERCTVDDACPVGYLCGFGVCQPHCVSDSECANGRCDRYRGLCLAPLTAPGGVGATCANNAACRSNNCSTGWPGGWCMTYCSMERGTCPDDAVCVRGTPEGDSGYCARRCTTPADCQRPGAQCVSGHCD